MPNYASSFRGVQNKAALYPHRLHKMPTFPQFRNRSHCVKLGTEKTTIPKWAIMRREIPLVAGWSRRAVGPPRQIRISNHLVVTLQYTHLVWRFLWPDSSAKQLRIVKRMGKGRGTWVHFHWIITERKKDKAKASTPQPWLLMVSEGSIINYCFQEQWKPLRCPTNVQSSQSCYHMIRSLGSYWAQTKESPGTRQIMNLGCKILSTITPFWPVILYHMSSGLQIPIKQQFAILDL